MSDSSISRRPSSESVRSGCSMSILESESDRLPPRVHGLMAWDEKNIDPKSFVLMLNNEEVQTIKHAVVAIKREKNIFGWENDNDMIASLSKSTFSLPTGLSDKLSALSTQIHNGRGVAIVRGLGAANFNDKEAVIAFVGVCAHVCPLRATDSYGNITLAHVRDASKDKVLPGAERMGLAGSKLPVAMFKEFHSDRFSGDVLAIHVRSEGKGTIGGEQYISSFWKVYNELLETDPTVLETMAAADWPFELKQGHHAPPNLEPGPTLFFADGKPMVQHVNAPLRGGAQLPRDKSMPPLSAKQVHASKTLEELAHRFSVKLDRRQGDIQFINNLSIMHARRAYSSAVEGKAADRHFLRMFLRDSDNEWAKPRLYQKYFDKAFTSGRPENFPIMDNDPWRIISGRESHG